MSKTTTQAQKKRLFKKLQKEVRRATRNYIGTTVVDIPTLTKQIKTTLNMSRKKSEEIEVAGVEVDPKRPDVLCVILSIPCPCIEINFVVD